ncbi:ferredoxin-type protein NapF [Vibrio sp. 99-70-13A1]|uniref:ferredoxin-type protein NapF n=1 Tax=Vibrio sp. 99-70-13A1 TaxID=2607601 RepID=UPI0014936340|nr:ferredoxin-type protein NapF [Vibrio sp. 99-70-13A1]NOH99235.1 ferredoxin-type protein NapF [Vibrio sp. 99-70-13A1]
MTEQINSNRRGFLTRLSKPVTKAVSGEEKSQRKQARPPKAVDEILFERLCDGCGLCEAACPNSVIEMAKGTALLNLDYNSCSFCEQCSQACPAGALHQSITPFIDLVPRFMDSCNNYMQIDCQACVSSCPVGAIQIEQGELPLVDDSLCNGCGLCRSACYIGAVTLSVRQTPA